MNEDELVALYMARTGTPEHIAMPRVAIMKHGFDPEDPETLAT